jgi:DNA helicase HerA-like ATPase
MNFKLGDHFGLFGGTGSGKTSILKEFLKQFAIQTEGKIPIYLFDTKMDGALSEFYRKGVGVRYFGNEKLPPLLNKDNSPFVVISPEFDDKGFYDAVFEQIYRNRRPALVVIDELSSVTNNQYPPKYFDILFKQGRSLGISMLVGNQAARYLPTTVVDQLMHVIVMNLNNKRDWNKMEDLIGEHAKTKPAHQHGFYYRNLKYPMNNNKGKVNYFSDLRDFFGF